MLFGRLSRFAYYRKPYYYGNVTYNTRDLGGYKTKDGKYMVKPGKLIRSQSLQNINKNGVKFLRQKGVTLNIDLRNSVQRQGFADFDDVKHNGIQVVYDMSIVTRAFLTILTVTIAISIRLSHKQLMLIEKQLN